MKILKIVGAVILAMVVVFCVVVAIQPAKFVLTPEGDGTKVSWSYDGANSGIMGKTIWVFMKGALDTQFDQGLNDLKKIVESNSGPAKYDF